MRTAANHAVSVILIPLLAAGFLFELGRLGFAGGRQIAQRFAQAIRLL